MLKDSLCTLLTILVSGPCAYGLKLSRQVPTLPELTVLTSNRARCMDGSQAGFFYEPATNVSVVDNWVIWLGGGAECSTFDNCKRRVPGANNPDPLGCTASSENWLTGCYESHNPISSRSLIHPEQRENPKMFDWNRVYLPYCSQDLWAGTRPFASDETFGYRFAGHDILDAAVTYLQDNHNLKQAKNVVLGGESAGGTGTWLHVDWLQEQVPEAKVVAAPLGGYYDYAYPYTGEGAKHGATEESFEEDSWPRLVALWDSYLPEKCKAQFSDPSRCMLAAHSRPFIDAPAFVIQAQTDSLQFSFHDNIATSALELPSPEIQQYMIEWQQNQTQSFEATLKDEDGLFNPACLLHSTFYSDGPLIDGKNYIEAFNDWLFNNERVNLKDDCGILCGDRCPGSFYVQQEEDSKPLVYAK